MNDDFLAHALEVAKWEKSMYADQMARMTLSTDELVAKAKLEAELDSNIVKIQDTITQQAAKMDVEILKAKVVNAARLRDPSAVEFKKVDKKK